MGSVLAAALARGGHHVSLLGRETPHLAAIRSEGLRLEHLNGTIERVALDATSDPAIVSAAELAIVLTKSGDSRAAMRAIRPHVTAELTVLTLQNGLGNVERIREALGSHARVLVGVTSQAARRLAPGAVVHTGEGPTIIGYLAAADAPVAAAIARVLAEAGLPAMSVADIERWVWRKLALNAAINGLTALGGFRNGCIAEDPGLLESAEIIAEEVASVARERGLELGSMRRAIAELARATAGNRSSMLQDLEAGRPTEVDAMHEAVLALAAEAGVAMPATRIVAALIRARERRAVSAGLEHE
jgi:2-dehydropantoate 2-reductase